jgi:glucose-6-phosphate 1-dehydrogenase
MPGLHSVRPSPPPPFTLVIFGASGDLTRRKLIPAVYSLFCEGLLPEAFSLVGFARRPKSDEEFREETRGEIAPDAWAEFAPRLHYHTAAYDQPEGYAKLLQRLNDRDLPSNALFYFAVPPETVTPIVEQLQASGLARRGNNGSPWSRIIVEKPFGRDLDSARELNAHLAAAFDESQIFRIDHYLGKETVQNLLVLRFANSIFEPLWNHKYVDHVQITVSETLGVEGRGGYYDQAGALRDIVQNHIIHLLCLVAMEAPRSLNPNDVRDEKVKVIRALRPISKECIINGVVRAQYGRHGETPGYLEEPDVAPDSRTDTFVAFRSFVDNWRWADVPFYIRTGKRLPARITEISVHFKAVPPVLFNAAPFGPLEPNVLCIRIQPNEGISLRFEVKTPGPAMRLEPYRMDFGYHAAFGKGPPDAYERLLLDAALGDATLFTRSDEVEAAWEFVAPVIEGCEQQDSRPLPQYPAGSWGPKEADRLIEADGRHWFVIRRKKPC